MDESDGIAACEHAWDLGVRYFDTAPQYGYGLAERRVGKVLRQHPRDSYVLSTKVGRLIRPASAEELARPSTFAGTTDDRPVWDFSRDGVRRSLDESLARLGVERVDIVFLHTLTTTGSGHRRGVSRRSMSCAPRESSAPSAQA